MYRRVSNSSTGLATRAILDLTLLSLSQCLSESGIFPVCLVIALSLTLCLSQSVCFCLSACQYAIVYLPVHHSVSVCCFVHT